MQRALGAWLGMALAAAGALAAVEPAPPAREPGGEHPALALSDRDRLLVLAPHPDDETIGCGGVIQAAAARGIPVQVLFFTYGDNNQWSFVLYRKHPVLKPESVEAMGRIRRGEAQAAVRLLGLDRQHLVFLGYPDFGTLKIWESHWGDRPPFKSMLTRATAVPYADAYRPGAPYTGDSVLEDLRAVLRKARPTKVFLPHPSDHNPDHRALFLFARIALWQLEPDLRPECFPYLVHFPKWPQPKRLDAERPLEPPDPLRASIRWSYWPLDPAQRDTKARALRAHASQFRYSGAYLSSFVRENEVFGDYPPIVLSAADGTGPGADRLDEQAHELHEELTDEERTEYTGVEWNFVRRDGDALVLAVDLTRPLFRSVRLVVTLVGFRPDRPFSEMPKLRAVLGELTCRVHDRLQRLDPNPIEVARHERTVRLRVPLAALGQPDRLLMSAHTSGSDTPFDWTAWRVIVLPDPAAPEPGPGPGPAPTAPGPDQR